MSDDLRSHNWIQLGRGGAALLVEDDNGEDWEHQANGVSCWHPSERGNLKPLSEAARSAVYDRFWGRLPSKLEVNQFCQDFGLPYASYALSERMEAWVPLVSTDGGPNAILVWNNQHYARFDVRPVAMPVVQAAATPPLGETVQERRARTGLRRTALIVWVVALLLWAEAVGFAMLPLGPRLVLWVVGAGFAWFGLTFWRWSREGGRDAGEEGA